MKAKDLAVLSKEELLVKQKSLLEELAKMNMQRYAGNVEKPHKFSLIKKDLARILTIFNQKKEN